MNEKRTVNELCPICEREIGEPCDEHHLLPKSKGGRETIRLHKICHSKIHSVFNRNQLSRDYNSIEKIRKHPEIEKFITWVSNKPPTFYKRTKKKRD